MTSANINGWYYIKLTLKSLDDGTSTKVFNLSNRPLIDEADGATVYWPILKSISNIGTDTGDCLPLALNGEIVLDDSPNSFGFERKFSDFLDRFAIIGSTIQVYSANTALDDSSITADFSLDWTTFVIGAQSLNNELRIAVSEIGLSDKIITKQIDTTNFSSAPNNVIGKYIPLIIGKNNVVKAIRISADTDEAPNFAYGVTFGSDFVNGGVNKYYVPNHFSGKFCEIASVTSESSAHITIGNTTGVNYGLNWTTFEYACAFEANPVGTGFDEYFLLSNGRIWCRGQNNPAITPTGDLIFSLYITEKAKEDDTTAWVNYAPTNAPLAQAKVSKADYLTQVRGAADFWVDFHFNTPVPIFCRSSYYISVQATTYSGSATTDFTSGGLSSITMSDAVISRTIGKAWEGSATGSVGGQAVRIEIFGIKITDTTTPSAGQINSSGIGHSYLTLAKRTPATLQNLASRQILVDVDGIEDPGSSFITISTAPSVDAPRDVIKMLDLTYNGTNWTSSNNALDYTKFSTSHALTYYPRKIKGYFDSRTSVLEAMSEICRNSASRIVRYNGASKQFAFYAWGLTNTTQKVISDEDAKILSIKRLGTETTINRVVIDRNYPILNFDYDSIDLSNASYIYDKNTSSFYSTICSKSQSLYDVRELSRTDFKYLSEEDSSYISSIAQFYLRAFQYPSVYVELEVPLFKYKSLETMDVIEICHPSLPAYYGTSSNAKLPYYGSGTDDLLEGYYWKRFQRYRAQIEGKVLNYNLGEFPTMRLNCRLLLNPSDPT